MFSIKKLIVTLGMTGVLLLGTTFIAYASGPETTRLAGNDRYETSALISKEGWSQSDYAVLVTGEKAPDALCAAPLAKKYNAPILLGNSGSKLNEQTKLQLQNLGVKKVFIIGGAAAISQAIEAEIQVGMGIETERIAGISRYDTSVKIAEALQMNNEEVILTRAATPDEFADALSAAPIAANKGMPIILVPKDKVGIDPNINKYANEHRDLGIKAYVIGGQNIISDSVADLFGNYTRIPGNDIYERNAAIINEFYDSINFNNVFVATGEKFPDALAGSALAAMKAAPIVLTSASPHDVTKGLFSANTIDRVYVLGGEKAVSTDTLNALLSVSSGSLTVKDVAKFSNAVVSIETKNADQEATGSGSGFIVSSNGKVITNYHVIEYAASAEVTLESGKKYQVEGILNYSKKQDIAVLKLKDASNLPVVKLGDSNKIELGDEVVTIGNPEGYKNTVTKGNISGLDRESTLRDGKDFQFTAPIAAGSSGGCLLNMKGEVIGITYAGYDSGNINFAIPINEAKPLVSNGDLITLSELRQKSIAYFPQLPTVPMIPDLTYVDSVVSDDGQNIMYKYNASDATDNIVRNYFKLLENEGWIDNGTDTLDSGKTVYYYKKDSHLIGITLIGDYVVIIGDKH